MYSLDFQFLFFELPLPPNFKKCRHTRLFSGPILPLEEIARRKAARAKFANRFRVVFEKLRPQLMEKYYNWFIAVDPDSEEYSINSSLEGLVKKIRYRFYLKKTFARDIKKETGKVNIISIHQSRFRQN
ncbi:MAG: hypothetical protein SWX82_34505 [Cyanobacteriota bacterium]|nr:hypothetical protein [Cyanobacteriota bacterium]